MSIIKGNFRPGSVRGPGLRIELAPHQIGSWLFQVGQAVAPGSSVYRAASVLASVIGPDGRLDPAKAWIAEKVGLCERTVARALSKLVHLGFLTWHRRTAVSDGIEHQTSNAYQLQFPEAKPAAPETPQPPSTPPSSALSVDREDSILPDKGLSDTKPRSAPSPAAESPVEAVIQAVARLPLRMVRKAQTALAARREAMEARLRAEHARRLGESPAYRIVRSGDVPS